MRALGLSFFIVLTGCGISPAYEATEIYLPRYVGTDSPEPLPEGDVSRCGDPERIAAIDREALGDVLRTSACGRIIFDDQLGSPYVLESLSVVLDGASVFDRHEDDGAAPPSIRAAATNVLAGFVSAGEHTLNVTAHYGARGSGERSYLNAYKFEVRSTHSFVVGQSRSFDVRLVTFQDGDTTTPLENRPMVRFVDSGVASGDP